MKSPGSQRTGSVPQHPGSVSSGYCKLLGFSSEVAKMGIPQVHDHCIAFCVEDMLEELPGLSELEQPGWKPF